MSPSAEPVDVAVITHRAVPGLRETVTRLLGDEAVARVVLVDTGRDPNLAEVVATMASAERPGRLSFLPIPNTGFAAAANRALAVGTAPWVAVVGPDVHLSIGFAEQQDALRGKAAGAAVAAGRLRSARGAGNARRACTPKRELTRAVLGTRRTERPQPANFLPIRVDQLDGALMLLQRRTWQALGGFDERFELFYEDVDLCRRAAAWGGCWLLPLEAGEHLGGATTGPMGTPAYVALRVSRLRYLRLHYGRVGQVCAVLTLLVETFVRTITRQGEGVAARAAAAVATAREVRRPNSVWVLPGRPQRGHPSSARTIQRDLQEEPDCAERPGVRPV